MLIDTYCGLEIIKKWKEKLVIFHLRGHSVSGVIGMRYNFNGDNFAKSFCAQWSLAERMAVLAGHPFWNTLLSHHSVP